MKKSALMKILDKIEGDQEIFLWNEDTGTYQDIDVTLDHRRLVQLSFDSYLQFIQEERRKESGDPEYTISAHELKQAKNWYAKNGKWELNPWVTEEEIETNVYSVKTVRMLKPKATYVGLGVPNH